MKSAEINIAGLLFRVTCAEEKYSDVVDWLKEDFLACSAPDSTETSFKLISEIEINDFEKPKGLPIFWRPGLITYKNKSSTYYSYNSDETKLEITFTQIRKLKIYGRNIDRLYNIIYLAIISHVVETLESNGYMPLHAFSAAYKDQNFALVAPPGFGKSLLAIQLMSDPEFKVYGDELLFISESQILPLPLRFAIAAPALESLGIERKGLRPLFLNGRLHKVTLPAPVRLVASPSEPALLPKLDKLFYITKQNSHWQIVSEKISGLMPWFTLLSASGVPQMLQYLLRFNFICKLPLLIWRRYKMLKALEREGKYFAAQGSAADVAGLKNILR